MKTIKSKSRRLVQQILSEEFLEANDTLVSLLTEAEQDREDTISGQTLDQEDAETDQTQTNDANLQSNQPSLDQIDQPSDGSPNLGDSLDNSFQDNSISQGESDEMTNDVIEIKCEVNQKIISKLCDKIANLKTALISKQLDKDSREYITLETSLAYYGNHLSQLQTKTNQAIDQDKVQQKIEIISAALKTLETQIGTGPTDVSDVQSTAELQQNQQQFGDTAQDQVQSGQDNDEQTENEK